MLSSPIKFLIILLALLQFVAPLVHAHTGVQHSSQNVHLPKFEYLSVNSDSSPVFQALTALYYIDASSIITVGSAIQHKKNITHHSTPYFLPANPFFIISVVQQHSIKHPPIQQSYIQARHYYLFPARAPPSFF